LSKEIEVVEDEEQLELQVWHTDCMIMDSMIYFVEDEFAKRLAG